MKELLRLALEALDERPQIAHDVWGTVAHVTFTAEQARKRVEAKRKLRAALRELEGEHV